jgi:hypothetical protein
VAGAAGRLFLGGVASWGEEAKEVGTLARLDREDGGAGSDFLGGPSDEIRLLGFGSGSGSTATFGAEERTSTFLTWRLAVGNVLGDAACCKFPADTDLLVICSNFFSFPIVSEPDTLLLDPEPRI